MERKHKKTKKSICPWYFSQLTEFILRLQFYTWAVITETPSALHTTLGPLSYNVGPRLEPRPAKSQAPLEPSTKASGLQRKWKERTKQRDMKMVWRKCFISQVCWPSCVMLSPVLDVITHPSLEGEASQAAPPKRRPCSDGRRRVAVLKSQHAPYTL